MAADQFCNLQLMFPGNNVNDDIFSVLANNIKFAFIASAVNNKFGVQKLKIIKAKRYVKEECS